MITIEYSSRYLRQRSKFLKNNPQLLIKTIKAISIFVKNPQRPSLNLEKLRGEYVWTIRIDRANRIFFVWFNKLTALFIAIGKHDKYSKY